MDRSDKYTYRLQWSPEGGEYVGLCAEFPSLSWLDKDRDRAFAGITQLVRECVEDMEQNGEATPEPFSLRKYCGNIEEIEWRLPASDHSRRASGVGT